MTATLDTPRPPSPLDSTSGVSKFGDKVFGGLSKGAGILILIVLAAVAAFLIAQAIPTFTNDFDKPFTEYVGPLIFGTIWAAFLALVIATPLAVGVALFTSHYAPRRLAAPLGWFIDLLAAVPSVVYGLWGAYLLQGQVIGIARWINTWFGWIPIFKVNGADPDNPLSTQTVYSASVFIAGLVVAMMVMPIACVVMRQVFSQVPIGEREGAYALGSTRWGMIRVVALPFARGGIIGGTMLGLGRALGETIAVALILSPRNVVSLHILEAGGNTVSAHIANRYAEEQGFGLSALFAAGLVLFGVTLFINFTASWFISRSRSGASSEA